MTFYIKHECVNCGYMFENLPRIIINDDGTISDKCFCGNDVNGKECKCKKFKVNKLELQNLLAKVV